MCVIAASDGKQKVSEEKFLNCFMSNPDGFGMMWAEDGKIKRYKTLILEEAYDSYKVLYDRLKGSSPIILHFRIGTQGPNDLSNCHPFKVSDKVSFCHNGIISQYSDRSYSKFTSAVESKESDTVLFNEGILKRLPEDFVKNSRTLDFIEEFIYGDKLVFLDILDGKPAVTIVNKNCGVVDEETGIWYSNDAYAYAPYMKFANKKAQRCDHCNSILLTKEQKTLGYCATCIDNMCCACGEVHDQSIKIEHDGISMVFCPDCLDIQHPIFMGAFPENQDHLMFPVGTEWTPIFSHSMFDVFTIKGVSGGKVVVENTDIQTGGFIKQLTYSTGDFSKKFYQADFQIQE